MDTKQKFRRKNAKFESLELQQKKKRTRRIVFYAVMLVSFTAVFFVLWFLVFFKVKDVEIVGSTRYSADEIRAVVGIAEGDNLYASNEDDVEALLTEKLPYIRTVKLKRKLPSTVVITVEEEQAVMFSNLYGNTYLISESLNVLERADGADLTGLVEVSAGEIRRCFAGEELVFTDSRMAWVVKELYNELKEYGLIDKVNSFTIENRFDISIRYDDRLDIYFGSIDDINIKVRFLVGIMGHLYEDEKGKLDISNIKEASFSRYQ